MTKHLKNYSLLYISLFIGVIYLIPSFAHAFSDPVQVQIGANNHPIRNVWTALLDFSNVVALIFFLGIAFANLLRIQISVYGIKKILPSLIVGIILANFSLLICQLLLDLSGAAAGLFEEGRGFIGYWLSDAKTFGATTDDNFVREIISSLLKFAAAIMTMVLAVMFVLRNYILMFLVVFSPIAFLSMSVPASKAIWTRWWKAFSQWTFMLPVAMFWLWVGANFFQFTDQFNSTEVAFFTGISFAGYVFGMICVYLAMTTPFRMAGELQSIAKKVQSAALTATGVYAGTRLAQNAVKVGKEYGEIAALKATPLGMLRRAGKSAAEMRGAIKSSAEAGTLGHSDFGKTVAKYTGINWLDARRRKITTLSKSHQSEMEAGAQDLTERAVHTDRRAKVKLAQAEKVKEQLAAMQAINKATIETRKYLDEEYQQRQKTLRTIKEEAEAERDREKSAREITYLEGEHKKEAADLEKLDNASFRDQYNHLKSNGDNKDTTAAAISRMTRLGASGAMYANYNDLAHKAADKNYAGNASAIKDKEIADNYLKARKSAAKLNGGTAVDDASQFAGLINKYKAGEGSRVGRVQTAKAKQMAAAEVITKREGVARSDFATQEALEDYQVNRMDQLLAKIGATAGGIIDGSIAPADDDGKELLGIVDQLRKKHSGLINLSGAKLMVDERQAKIDENPAYRAAMMSRMKYKIVSPRIDEETKSLDESLTAEEIGNKFLKDFDPTKPENQELLTNFYNHNIGAIDDQSLIYLTAQSKAIHKTAKQLGRDNAGGLRTIGQMLEKSIREHNIDVNKSYVIGDKNSDLGLAKHPLR
ncbi:MAG: hypothetical protein UT11_C0006G0010 [Berkelbacteria bacterium GW2011_GWA2_38_9]|uniref:Uncharacterized protein n=1 Tax=Berkelbacteria bacterium GW2011_GWA2_38_9 TaxID=1618334 RepID=A0A0G0PM95_9BACT|nr:MAG: hypothetical protein UT11_C0006G0010 [Berkelbacteria bacterium GW2011_GWA2_38_9]